MSRVGSIVFATNSGLGILAKTLYDYGIIDKVFIAEHKKFAANKDWYNQDDIYQTREELLANIDTLLIIECPLPDPFNWAIVEQASDLGIKLVLMPMYESTVRSHLVYFDEIICPSPLDLLYYEDYETSYIPVPVHKDVEWRLRTTAKTFVHNVGHGGIMSRNGTQELINALPFIKSDIDLTLRVQADANEQMVESLMAIDDDRVSVVAQNVPFKKLWTDHDVFIFPEKFNGLSLPLQEAYAAGMFVIACDRFPINTWLPKDGLIPIEKIDKTNLNWIGIDIPVAVISPEKIAEKIDLIANKDISEYSLLGKQFNEQSAKLKEKYDGVLRC